MNDDLLFDFEILNKYKTEESKEIIYILAHDLLPNLRKYGEYRMSKKAMKHLMNLYKKHYEKVIKILNKHKDKKKKSKKKTKSRSNSKLTKRKK